MYQFDPFSIFLLDVLNLAFYINLIASLVIWIPGVILLNYYRKLKDLDYLIFGLFFIFSTFDAALSTIVEVFPDLLLFNLLSLAVYINMFLLYIHVLRVKWDEPPRFLVYLGILLFGYIFIMIPFTEEVGLSGPIKFLFFDMYTLWGGNWHIYAVMTEGGVVLYDQQIIYQFVRPFVMFFAVYAYLTSPTISQEKENQNLKYIWSLMFFMVGLSNIVLIPDLFLPNWPFGINNLLVITITFLMVLLAYIFWPLIAVLFPKVLLLTHTQVARALELYKTMSKQETEEKSLPIKIGTSQIVDYLKSLPPDLIEEIG
ncbi:MAG: hypothetical protein ACFFCZ_10710 [Promethearchaeota archaeon]